MSTRSQVIIKDSYEEQWFYRHSDGYPSGNMPELYKFMKWLDEGKIRPNVEQSSGWLVLIGADEYGYDYDYKTGTKTRKKNLFAPSKEDSFSGWKCGAYEPCACKKEHGDIEWLYTIDIEHNKITIKKIWTGEIKTYAFEELMKYEKDWQKLEDSFKESS